MRDVSVLRAYMQDEELDAIFITSRENMQWYTGFSGDTGSVLVTMEREYFITDFRYLEMAENELGTRYTYIKARTGGAIKGLYELVEQGPTKTLGIEMDKTSMTTYAAYEELWPFEYKAVDAFLAECRQVKDDDTIARMKEGASIVSDIFDHLLGYVKIGVSEFDILAEMQYQMNVRGCTPSFDPIIAGGEHSSLPHAVVTDRALQAGDLLTMDFGVRYQGVCTDFTRTVAIGGLDDDLCIIYNIVKEANLAALDAVRAGVACADVDAAARNIIINAGYGAYYEHGTGHGVGVEIHEAPWLSIGNQGKLQEGMVLTIEPGIYLPGKGGVRIEDMLAVTAEGYDNFYTVTKELIVIE